MSAVSTILLIVVLLSLTNQSADASYSSLLTQQQQQQQQQQNQTSGNSQKHSRHTNRFSSVTNNEPITWCQIEPDCREKLLYVFKIKRSLPDTGWSLWVGCKKHIEKLASGRDVKLKRIDTS